MIEEQFKKIYGVIMRFDLQIDYVMLHEEWDMKQLRVYGLKVIRDLNHQYRAYNKCSGISKV